MPPSLEELGLLKLSREDRRALAHALLDSIDSEADVEPLSDELKAELERRSADAEADLGGGIPWEVVKAEALARLRS